MLNREPYVERTSLQLVDENMQHLKEYRTHDRLQENTDSRFKY